ncbi:MAG: hypothetical protein M3N33_11890 [Actinomycetota bacterium]|nr:hypothetical protein [Actinomycetota bacterium]
MAHTPEAGRRILSAWAVLAAALLISLGAASVIVELRGHADKDRRTVLALKDIETQAYRLSSLEWQAVAEGRVSPEVAEQVQGARGSMSSLLDGIGRLEQMSEEEESVRRVAGAFRAYDAFLAS